MSALKILFALFFLEAVARRRQLPEGAAVFLAILLTLAGLVPIGIDFARFLQHY